MTANDDRLNLRARQLLDDPTLPQNLKIKNGAALLQQLALTVRGDATRRASLLAEITDEQVRTQLDAALTAAGA